MDEKEWQYGRGGSLDDHGVGVERPNKVSKVGYIPIWSTAATRRPQQSFNNSGTSDLR